jgi:hypothetical protein
MSKLASGGQNAHINILAMENDHGFLLQTRPVDGGVEMFEILGSPASGIASHACTKYVCPWATGTNGKVMPTLDNGSVHLIGVSMCKVPGSAFELLCRPNPFCHN